MKPLHRFLSALALFALALGARLAFLHQTLDADEMATAAWSMSKNFGELFEQVYYPIEGNAAGYPVFIFLWGKLGMSEAWLRLPSVLAGALTVLLFFRHYSRRLPPLAVFLASAQLALAWVTLSQSQSARVYSPWLLFSLVCLVLHTRLLEGRNKPTLASLLAYAAASALLLYLHHFSFLYLAVLWAHLGWKVARRERSFTWLGAPAIALLLYLPHLPLLLFQMQNGPRWYEPFRWSNVVECVKGLLWMHQGMPSLLLGTAAALGLLTGGRKFLLEAAWASLPILAAALLSLYVRDVFADKYFSPSALGFFALAASGYGFLETRGRIARACLAAAGLTAVALTLVNLPAYYATLKSSDWRGASEFVWNHREECSSLVISEPFCAKRWPYYLSSPLVVKGWENGFPHEPFWLVAAGHTPLPAPYRAIGERMGSLRWQGRNAVVFCIRPPAP